ncbi:hypothetical protein E4T50_10736 [Aureobasidium sp. EXF-12298]|nr:hypothetical protein E4T50_10736 [Aureobasidium sp. EXF-12298]
MPTNHSTMNWLGFEDVTGFTGSLNHDWQYPDHLCDFYMPASAPQSISAVSPVTSKDTENIVGGSTTRSSQSAFTPRDYGTTDAVGIDSRPTPPGEFYADGGTARLPRMHKRRATTRHVTYENPTQRFSMSLPPDPTLPSSDNEWLDCQGYAELQAHYSNFCTTSTALFAPFEAIELPPKALFDYLCDLYVDNCGSILPFIHFPSLRLRNRNPFLMLSMAAIGSHYLKNHNSSWFVLSLHEFVRRILFFAAGSSSELHIEPMTQYQITLLHAVGATYCGEKTLGDQAFALRLKLATFFWDEHGSDGTTLVAEDGWSQWITRESYLRLRHCTWLMDCIWSFQFQTRTTLSLSDATIALPANENLWNAGTASHWARLMHEKPVTPDLATAINELYMSKKVAADVGEFARVLLIYGLHRRLSEVAAYYVQSLSHWVPTDQSPAVATISHKAPIWLPSLPVFRQWQNLTCDSLDVLHWAANATIGEASGFEHPTVLHLHLARVILLTPIREIVSLARYLAGEKGLKSEAVAMGDRQAVHRWAIQHQYKARLAAVHAGVVFWHVRRFSTNAFYEPTAVAHAALVLWAFSAFSSKTAKPPGLQADEIRPAPANVDTQTDGNSSDSESSSDTIILLDRPADDEIVQEFVLNGPRVGDLYGDKGPERVVREGARILRTLGCWREWESWANVLDKLVVVCKRERRKMKEAALSDSQAISISSTRDAVDG